MLLIIQVTIVYAGEAPSALNEHRRQIGAAHGGPAVALFTIAGGGSADSGSFAQKVSKDIGANLQAKGGRYYKSWDSDGVGVFHKATVEAENRGNGIYELHIYAAYVSNRPEVDLAKKLNAPIGFARSTLTKEFTAANERFKIPLAEIEKIFAASGKKFDAQNFMTQFTKPRYDEYKKDEVKSYISDVIVDTDDTLVVRAGLTSYTAVSAHSYKDNPEGDYEYRIKDGFLTGPTQIWGKKVTNPELSVVIAPKDGATYDKAVEARILALADKIEAAWKCTPAPTTKADPIQEGPGGMG